MTVPDIYHVGTVHFHYNICLIYISNVEFFYSLSEYGIPFAPIGVYGGRSHLRKRISIIHNQLDPHIEYQEDNSTLIVFIQSSFICT